MTLTEVTEKMKRKVSESASIAWEPSVALETRPVT